MSIYSYSNLSFPTLLLLHSLTVNPGETYCCAGGICLGTGRIEDWVILVSAGIWREMGHSLQLLHSYTHNCDTSAHPYFNHH